MRRRPALAESSTGHELSHDREHRLCVVRHASGGKLLPEVPAGMRPHRRQHAGDQARSFVSWPAGFCQLPGNGGFSLLNANLRGFVSFVGFVSRCRAGCDEVAWAVDRHC